MYAPGSLKYKCNSFFSNEERWFEMNIMNPFALWRGIPSTTAGAPNTDRHPIAAIIVGIIEMLIIIALIVYVIACSFYVPWGWPLRSSNGSAVQLKSPDPGTMPNVPSAITKTLQDAKGQDVYFNLEKMTYGDGESGKNLTAAQKAESEARAARINEELRERAKAKRELGAYLIQKCDEERQKMQAHMEYVRQSRSGDARDDIHLLDAETSSINYQQLKKAGDRMYFQGRQDEAALMLKEVNEAQQETLAKPITNHPLVVSPDPVPPPPPARTPTARPTQVQPRTPVVDPYYNKRCAK
jgi:hypothetical protein